MTKIPVSYPNRLPDRLSTEILIITFLVVSILTIYYQVINFDFLYFDDVPYVTNNPMVQKGITLNSIQWAFSSFGYASNWHPLTWISHMIDVEVFGLTPGGHHFTNVVFHIANTLLLFFIFLRMTDEKWKCAIVAALFAVHPLHAESVAWIAERKDVLSTFFLMLTIWSYIWYVNKPEVLKYLLVIILYILGLMSKPMLVTLPFILLLLDFWPIRRIEFVKSHAKLSPQGVKSVSAEFQWNRAMFLVWEKIPLFILAAMSSAITFLAQKRGGAIEKLEVIPMGSRIANAIISYTKYLSKTFCPINLSACYPYPKTFSPVLVVGLFLFLVFITLFISRFAKQLSYLLVGWLWYLGTLFPVIGIVQVGSQSMADRYSYISSIGIFIILAWGTATLLKRWKCEKYTPILFFVVIIPILMGLGWKQVGYWKDSIALFNHAVNVTENNYLAHSNLSFALYIKNDIDDAIYHAQKAVDIAPNYINALYNLGHALNKKRHFQEAIIQFRKILQKDPNDVDSHYELGYAFIGQGKFDDAVAEFQKVLRLDPQYPEAQNALDVALEEQRRINNIIIQMNEALKSDPQNYILHWRLAELYRNKGNNKEAITHYEEALTIMKRLHK